MEKLDLKPTITADGALLLSICCGAFIAAIAFFVISDLHINPFVNILITILIFSVLVYSVGFKLARKIFASVRILLDGNLMTVFKHSGKKDTIDIVNIKHAVFIENIVYYQDHKYGTKTPYTHRYLILNLKDAPDYWIFLDGFRSVWTESLLSYISRHNPAILLERKKLVNGQKVT